MDLSVKDFQSVATKIRKYVVKMIHKANSGHPGGSLSCTDILTVLYFDTLKIDPQNPRWVDRDRFILSKGHACPAHYSALALKGFFPVEELMGLRKLHHFLEGHPDIKIPGVDAPSGSLGMGLSQGLGMALGAQYTKKNFMTYVLLGDGDMEEGNTWEALMACGHYKLDNLVAILDANGFQGEDRVEKQMDYFPVVDKIQAFKWHVVEINGHDFLQIREAFAEARRTKKKPTFILAKTIKGKGVSFMENNPYWHGSVGITNEQLDIALRELGE